KRSSSSARLFPLRPQSRRSAWPRPRECFSIADRKEEAGGPRNQARLPRKRRVLSPESEGSWALWHRRFRRRARQVAWHDAPESFGISATMFFKSNATSRRMNSLCDDQAKARGKTRRVPSCGGIGLPSRALSCKDAV